MVNIHKYKPKTAYENDLLERTCETEQKTDYGHIISFCKFFQTLTHRVVETRAIKTVVAWPILFSQHTF